MAKAGLGVREVGIVHLALLSARIIMLAKKAGKVRNAEQEIWRVLRLELNTRLKS